MQTCATVDRRPTPFTLQKPDQAVEAVLASAREEARKKACARFFSDQPKPGEKRFILFRLLRRGGKVAECLDD
jgi:hypothetical protein